MTRAISQLHLAFMLALWTMPSQAGDATRTELRRGELTGTNMEIVVSITEAKPGDTIMRHTHHGEEAFYVLEGATVENASDGARRTLAGGSASINKRDVPHAGYTVVGDKALKLLTVHVVDKGKMLYEPAP